MGWLDRGVVRGGLIRSDRIGEFLSGIAEVIKLPILSLAAWRSMLHPVSDRPAWNEAGCGYTSRQHNAHITESREVLYRWHPWYGHTVWIVTTIERKNAESALRCGQEPFDTAALLEVPQWMFDPVACCRITSATSPAVTCAFLPMVSWNAANAVF